MAAHRQAADVVLAWARAARLALAGDVLVKAPTNMVPHPPSAPMAPPTFAELLGRLTRGRLGDEVAADLLLVDAERVSLNIDIDRDTGLVRHWRMRTHQRFAPGVDQSNT